MCGAAGRVEGGLQPRRVRSRCRCVVGTVLGLSAAAGAASAPPRHAQSLSHSGPHVLSYSGPYVRVVFTAVSLAAPPLPSTACVYSHTVLSVAPSRPNDSRLSGVLGPVCRPIRSSSQLKSESSGSFACICAIPLARSGCACAGPDLVPSATETCAGSCCAACAWLAGLAGWIHSCRLQTRM